MVGGTVAVEVGAHHRRARRAEQHGRGPADPRRRPGDDGHAAGEVEGAQRVGVHEPVTPAPASVTTGARPWMDCVTRRAAPSRASP